MCQFFHESINIFRVYLFKTRNLISLIAKLNAAMRFKALFKASENFCRQRSTRLGGGGLDLLAKVGRQAEAEMLVFAAHAPPMTKNPLDGYATRKHIDAAPMAIGADMSRTDPGLRVRIPPEMKSWLEEQATKNLRSMSAEVVLSVRQRMERERQTKTAPESAGTLAGA